MMLTRGFSVMFIAILIIGTIIIITLTAYETYYSSVHPDYVYVYVKKSGDNVYTIWSDRVIVCNGKTGKIIDLKVNGSYGELAGYIAVNCKFKIRGKLVPAGKVEPVSEVPAPITVKRAGSPDIVFKVWLNW